MLQQAAFVRRYSYELLNPLHNKHYISTEQMPDHRSKSEPNLPTTHMNPNLPAPVVPRPDPPIAPPQLLLDISTYARMAVNAGVSTIEKQFRGRITLRGEPRDTNELERDTRALQQAERQRCAATLEIIDKMTGAERNECFVDAFRNDPELVSGLSAFEQIENHHNDLLHEALNDAWKSLRPILMRRAAV